jgi:hypothetical protein
MGYSQMAPLGSAALPDKELELLNALNSPTRYFKNKNNIDYGNDRIQPHPTAPTEDVLAHEV